ncbi:MAG: hypothetical protein RM022_006180 [Nostoc sp. EfeVER01]|uniref:hypothetical protein n=1 Tax=unclassified Nostoc TaxID=2593658 RepID=UPI002AD57576|nr:MULTISPECIES: hypothetical protein [unclassified Nostoc]MDZ7948629.1 hypothetical protein [Nostoc sp. EfeVER01]MDZ7991106.1 hypothetical protein [Nostoc sp. EspVER01]
MPFVSGRDLQMYYEIRGTGQRLLSISGTSSYPLHELANLPSEKLAHRQITIADTRWQEEAWLSSRTTQFQKLVKLTLAVSQAGTDEPSREVGRRRQLEARAAHDTHNRLSQQ